MRPISLGERIAGLGDRVRDRVAVIAGDGQITYGDLFEAKHGGRWPRAALRADNVLGLVKGLVALDGSADALAVIPASLAVADLQEALSRYDLKLLDGKDQAVFAGEETDLSSLDDSESAGVGHDTQWLVATSGTTGRPKFIEHRLQSLLGPEGSRGATEGPAPTWGLLYDPGRFAGFQVLLRALVAGETVVVPDRSASHREQVSFLLHHGVTHMSATPTLWRKVLMSSDGRKLRLQQVTLGGEAADQTVLDQLRRTYPSARITHVYASTEVGLGFWVSDGKSGFPISFLEQGFDDIKLQVRGERLFVQSGTSAAKGEELAVDDRGWIDTGDLVELARDRFFVVGRANGTINVGGDKVLPEKVRHTILGHPLVGDAIAYGRSNPFTGAIVAADVSLKEKVDLVKAKTEIIAHCRSTLESHEVPRVIQIVDEIQLGASGKAQGGQVA